MQAKKYEALLHTGIKKARIAKNSFLRTLSNEIKAKYTDTVEEELCIRHGGSQLGKDWQNTARRILQETGFGYLVRKNGKSSGPYTWICSDFAKKYITTCFRDIALRNTTVEGKLNLLFDVHGTYLT